MGGKGGSVVYKKKKMDRIVNRILGMIVQSDLCGSRLISYHPPYLYRMRWWGDPSRLWFREEEWRYRRDVEWW
jgi:hypothetical protein